MCLRAGMLMEVDFSSGHTYIWPSKAIGVVFHEIFDMQEARLRTRRRAKHACLDVYWGAWWQESQWKWWLGTHCLCDPHTCTHARWHEHLRIELCAFVENRQLYLCMHVNNVHLQIFVCECVVWQCCVCWLVHTRDSTWALIQCIYITAHLKKKHKYTPRGMVW
jgi:hypothetical protein